MTTPFVKMSGAGNDFVIIDRRAGRGADEFPDPSSLVKAVCDRRRGIGADGVIILGPPEGGDFSMQYFNADGSSGSLCGNGGRCAASYVMGELGRDSVTFRTCGKEYRASRKGGGVLLSMDDAGPIRMNATYSVNNNVFAGHFIDTGSPHLVVTLVGGLPEAKGVIEFGRSLRYHPDFLPGGTNVDFIVSGGEDLLRVRTYERGVEDETWACGTGAVASAMAYSVLHGGEGRRSINVVPLSGETLVVGFRRDGMHFTEVSLEGPAVVTFRGSYEATTP